VCSYTIDDMLQKVSRNAYMKYTCHGHYIYKHSVKCCCVKCCHDSWEFKTPFLLVAHLVMVSGEGERGEGEEGEEKKGGWELEIVHLVTVIEQLLNEEAKEGEEKK